MTLLEVKFRIRKVQAETRWGVTLMAEGRREGDTDFDWYPLDTFRSYRDYYDIFHDRMPLDSGWNDQHDHFVDKDRDKVIASAADAYANYLYRYLKSEAEKNSRESTTVEITV